MSLHSTIVRRVLHPLTLWKRGETCQLAYEREFERTQYASPEELREIQTRRLQMLVKHAFASCAFYRERFAQAGVSPEDIRTLEDLRALPILEKTTIQARIADMVAEGWPGRDLIKNQTGGSTGTPVPFFLSRDRKCSRAAATLRHNRWAGWNVGDRAAVIWGAPRDRPDDSLRSRLRGALLREPLWLDTAGLTEATMEHFRASLARHEPRIIQAYARSAVVFARWLEATGKSVHAPNSIVTSAEVLEDNDRLLLERVFGCPVFNRYGCREVSVVASECDAHAGMHVMAEGLYLEIETPNGPAKPGESGSILVTDLLNHAMPLIRYRIGDVGSWAPGECPCGRHLPRLERVGGRVTDFLVGAGGKLVSGVFLATYVVAQRPSLGQVQIHQDRLDRVVYKLRPGPAFDPLNDGLYLEKATREYLGEGISAEVEIVDDLPRLPSGKFLFSRSTVSPTWMSRPVSQAVV